MRLAELRQQCTFAPPAAQLQQVPRSVGRLPAARPPPPASSLVAASAVGGGCRLAATAAAGAVDASKGRDVLNGVLKRVRFTTPGAG
jgi:hypothetical protein